MDRMTEPELMLPFADALAVVLEHAAALCAPAATETVALVAALDRSTRDGYALRARDIASPRRVVGSLRAGEAWPGPPLQADEAIEIMTGAPLPPGADAVLMLEYAELHGDTLTIAAGHSSTPQQNVVPRAAEARAGAKVLPAGRVLRAAEIAVAASCGAIEPAMYAKPRVAILATGDELVPIDQQPEAHQIRNSNTYALAALVEAEGALPDRLAIARDTMEDIERRIAQGSTADLLLLSGGVSKGKFDLVEQALSNHGAEFFFTGALIQPGKPIVFGRLSRPQAASSPDATRQWIYFFGLPGNPVSTQVCFHLFVAPLLRALAGRSDLQPYFVEAQLAEDVAGGAKVTRFLPAELTSTWDAVTVRVVGWQGSGDVAANARGNCYAVLPAGVARFSAGETIRVLLR
jgi:molybdopterin molybdotransferase